MSTGSHFCYNPNPHKTWLVVKPEDHCRAGVPITGGVFQSSLSLLHGLRTPPSSFSLPTFLMRTSFSSAASEALLFLPRSLLRSLSSLPLCDSVSGDWECGLGESVVPLSSRLCLHVAPRMRSSGERTHTAHAQ